MMQEARVPSRGFTLVEVLVALTLLSVGCMALAAAGGAAAKMLRDARVEERTFAAAGMVLDSLLQERDPESGERTVGRSLLRWTVGPEGGAILVRLEVDDGSIAGGGRVFTAFHAPAPPPLDEPP